MVTIKIRFFLFEAFLSNHISVHVNVLITWDNSRRTCGTGVRQSCQRAVHGNFSSYVQESSMLHPQTSEGLFIVEFTHSKT